MPIIDSEPYSNNNTEYILAVLDAMLEEEGGTLQDKKLFYFNVFLGGRFFRFEKEGFRTHVCRRTNSGYMFAVFHDIRRGDVLLTQSTYISEERDSCITLIWTADAPTIHQIEDALHFADEIVRAVELATGIPCPIPLGRLQVPSTFELAEVSIKQGTVQKIIISGEENPVPILDPRVSSIIYVLQGFDDEYNKLMKQQPHSVLHLAARWQQRAIRAFGTNEWADCIVASSTWVEIFSVQITIGINERLGAPIMDTRAALGRGLPRFLTAYLGSKYLGGRWDHTDQSTLFGEWLHAVKTFGTKLYIWGVSLAGQMQGAPTMPRMSS